MSKLIHRLIKSLTILPGVGHKSASRMAYHILEKAKPGGMDLSETLRQAIEKIGHCDTCHNLTELQTCECCQDTNRNQEMLCIVESPSDLVSIEQTQFYRGRYFVLMGRLSPLDNMTPQSLPIEKLLTLCQGSRIKEIIIATNPTIEGEATAQYLMDLLKPYTSARLTRLAHGVPMGGEIEYLDAQTIVRAMELRMQLDTNETVV